MADGSEVKITLLVQRVWAQVPAHTRWLTAMRNCPSRGSDILF